MGNNEWFSSPEMANYHPSSRLGGIKPPCSSQGECHAALIVKDKTTSGETAKEKMNAGVSLADTLTTFKEIAQTDTTSTDRDRPGFPHKNKNKNKTATTTERRDSMEINGEQAAESNSVPSMSNDLAGVEKLSDGESSDSSDTLIEVQEANNTTAAAAAATTTTPTTDEINIVKVNRQTEVVLEGLFESPERPTRAEQDQDKQETQTQEQEHTQELFTNKDDTEEKMETTQNNKHKPLSPIDLRTKFGQSPKPRRSPKHKRRKDKLR